MGTWGYCRQCGGSFKASHGNQRYCKLKCRQKHRNQRLYVVKCIECKLPVITRAPRKRKYCGFRECLGYSYTEVCQEFDRDYLDALQTLRLYEGHKVNRAS